MDEVIDTIKNPVPGLPTGLSSVDKVTGGYKPGQLIIVAGRSSMGKSAMAGDVALAQNKKVLFFSLEMSSVVLIQRLVANKANVEFRKLVDNELNEQERGRVRDAMKFLNNSKILIDDTPCLTPDQFCEKCAEHPDAEMIIVDHLHLMRHNDGRMKEVQALDYICQQLREYGKLNKVPIVLLCQLNRRAEERETHEPRLADLRGSGGIEQDSDIVLLLYRPAYYLQREIDFNTEDDGEAHVIVAKQRNGITGKLKAVFLGEFMSYRDSPNETMEDWT
jgi:replicative DNA helicase